jgi:arylsulfatase A-like enzyme
VKQKGYATAAVGKWHLGSLPQFLPVKTRLRSILRHSLLERHVALPSAGEEGRVSRSCRCIENDHVVDEEITPEDQTHLTTDYTARGVSFIEKNKDKPFFLYLAHSMVHVPLFVSDKFKGKSGKGLFGDVMMEVDWSVGQIVDAEEERPRRQHLGHLHLRQRPLAQLRRSRRQRRTVARRQRHLLGRRHTRDRHHEMAGQNPRGHHHGHDDDDHRSCCPPSPTSSMPNCRSTKSTA